MSESEIRQGDRVRLTGEHVCASGMRWPYSAPEGATGVVRYAYPDDSDVTIAWEGRGNEWGPLVAASSLTRIEPEPEPEPEPRIIRPGDVRVGDTIRVEWESLGVTITRTSTVASVDANGRPRTAEGGLSAFLGSVGTVTLLDRPELTLPTEPGSVILCAEVRGEPYDGIAVLDEDGDWWTPREVSDVHWHMPVWIGPGWRPARVVEVDQ